MEEQRTRQDAHGRDGWVARLVEAQLAVSTLGMSVEATAAEDRWPARLIRAGAVLIGVSGLALASWLRQHL